jgi:hypothetical protein
MKAILLTLTQDLYKKTKEYARENGIPIVGAIRLILNQFFKNKV